MPAPPRTRREARAAARGRRRVGTRRGITAAVAIAAVVGGSAATGASYAQAPNLVVNPGFEAGLAGWFANAPYALDLVDDARRGDHAVRLVNVADTARSGALNDMRNTIGATKAGVRYEARAYVRSDVPRQRVALRLMEYRGSALQGQRSTTVRLSGTDWQRVAVTWTALTDGSTLDLNVVGRALPPGASIVVDDIKLVEDGVGAPPADAVPAAGPTDGPTGGPTDGPTDGPTGGPTDGPTDGATDRTTGGPTQTPTDAPTDAPTDGPSSEPTREPAPSPRTSTGSPERPGWTLRWADEFDGSGVDARAWKVDHLSTYGDGNLELACLMNRPQNVFVTDGVLTIRARREAAPVACGNDRRFPGGRDYTSAMLRTTGSWTYGRFEMRAKLPTSAGNSKGLWPAFWMRPVGGGTGELDILETIGSGPDGAEARKIHHTLWYDYSGTHPKHTSTVTTRFDPAAGFHTYAVEWEKGAIRWYIDGELTYTRTTATTPWLDQAFSKPFFIRLNMAVGGRWPGSPTARTDFPADYEVDYVRVYQRG